MVAPLASLRDLGGGVRQSQNPLWQTNSMLAVADGETLLCDPGLMPGDLETLAMEAGRAGGAIYLLVTHADFDHTCGIGFFPGATVVAGEATAAAIESGEAGRLLAAAAPDWGATWPLELRVDRPLTPGEHVLGRFRIEAIEAPGHTADGLAFILLDQGVLLPGDYLSAMTYPFVTASFAEARATHERLLAALERHELRWVVPGHGPPLTPADARVIGQADLAYLEALETAARHAHERGLSPGRALVSVFGVEPPRATTDDFEVYGIRAFNARKALAETGDG
jgi:glyoxylase-like metal-dependent hydrolase (beta-lactamase superfamily II)